MVLSPSGTVIVVDSRWFAGSLTPVACIAATPPITASTVYVSDVARVLVIASASATLGSGGEGDGLGAALASATGAAFVPGLAQAPAVASVPAKIPTITSLLDLIASSMTPYPMETPIRAVA
jgi:hypothetical protein